MAGLGSRVQNLKLPTSLKAIGVQFIGPTAPVMSVLGDKIAANIWRKLRRFRPSRGLVIVSSQLDRRVPFRMKFSTRRRSLPSTSASRRRDVLVFRSC